MSAQKKHTTFFSFASSSLLAVISLSPPTNTLLVRATAAVCGPLIHSFALIFLTPDKNYTILWKHGINEIPNSYKEKVFKTLSLLIKIVMSGVNWKSWRAEKIINSEKSASLKCVRAVIIAKLVSSPNLIFISKSKLKDNVGTKSRRTMYASTRTLRICR